MAQDTGTFEGVCGDDAAATMSRLVLHLQQELTRTRAELEAVRVGCGALLGAVAELGGSWLLGGSGRWLDDGREESLLARMVQSEFEAKCGAEGVPTRGARVRLTPAFPSAGIPHPAERRPGDTTVVWGEFGRKS